MASHSQDPVHVGDPAAGAEQFDRLEEPQAIAPFPETDADFSLEMAMQGPCTQGCCVYSQYLYLTWLPGYLETTKHLTVLKAGLYTAIPYGIAVVLCIAMGRLSDRLLKGRGAATGRRRYVSLPRPRWHRSCRLYRLSTTYGSSSP